MLKFNSRINYILPIVLALLLPGLSIYSQNEGIIPDNPNVFRNWGIASSILYLFWYLLWFLWDIKSRQSQKKFLLILTLLSSIFFINWQFKLLPTSNVFEWYVIVRIVLPILLFLAIQSALKAQVNISTLRLEKEQMQTENYRVQLKALRTKIDPHFLFNSLNTLRSMVRQHHANSEAFIMSLSDFYRQVLKHNENTTLPISEELQVLQSYLFLMKNRNSEAVSVQLDIDRSLHHLHLPTLALQVVVENCFKHNSMTSKKPLNIEVKSTADQYIEITNNIQPKLGEQNSLGYGLDLLKKRYELMNIAQGVIVEKTPDQFLVKIKLFQR